MIMLKITTLVILLLTIGAVIAPRKKNKGKVNKGRGKNTTARVNDIIGKLDEVSTALSKATERFAESSDAPSKASDASAETTNNESDDKVSKVSTALSKASEMLAESSDAPSKASDASDETTNDESNNDLDKTVGELANLELENPLPNVVKNCSSIEQLQNLFSEADVDANEPSAEGYYPLTIAASRTGNKRLVVDIVKLLISKGANTNVADKWGITPLMQAELPEVTKVLLENGAEPDLLATGILTGTALFFESKDRLNSWRIQKIKLLLEAGADPNVSYKNEYEKEITNGYPIHNIFHTRSESSDIVAVIKLLSDAGANLDVKDSVNNTPMHMAIKLEKNAEDVVKALLDAGVNPACPNSLPLLNVFSMKTSEVEIARLVKLLIDGGALREANYSGGEFHISARDMGEKALESAIAKGKIHPARMLLEAGVEPYRDVSHVRKEDQKFAGPEKKVAFLISLYKLATNLGYRGLEFLGYDEQAPQTISFRDTLLSHMIHLFSQYTAIEDILKVLSIRNKGHSVEEPTQLLCFLLQQRISQESMSPIKHKIPKKCVKYIRDESVADEFSRCFEHVESHNIMFDTLYLDIETKIDDHTMQKEFFFDFSGYAEINRYDYEGLFNRKGKSPTVQTPLFLEYEMGEYEETMRDVNLYFEKPYVPNISEGNISCEQLIVECQLEQQKIDKMRNKYVKLIGKARGLEKIYTHADRHEDLQEIPLYIRQVDRFYGSMEHKTTRKVMSMFRQHDKILMRYKEERMQLICDAQMHAVAPHEASSGTSSGSLSEGVSKEQERGASSKWDKVGEILSIPIEKQFHWKHAEKLVQAEVREADQQAVIIAEHLPDVKGQQTSIGRSTAILSLEPEPCEYREDDATLSDDEDHNEKDVDDDLADTGDSNGESSSGSIGDKSPVHAVLLHDDIRVWRTTASAIDRHHFATFLKGLKDEGITKRRRTKPLNVCSGQFGGIIYESKLDCKKRILWEIARSSEGIVVYVARILEKHTKRELNQACDSMGKESTDKYSSGGATALPQSDISATQASSESAAVTQSSSKYGFGSSKWFEFPAAEHFDWNAILMKENWRPHFHLTARQTDLASKDGFQMMQARSGTGKTEVMVKKMFKRASLRRKQLFTAGSKNLCEATRREVPSDLLVDMDFKTINELIVEVSHVLKIRKYEGLRRITKSIFMKKYSYILKGIRTRAGPSFDVPKEIVWAHIQTLIRGSLDAVRTGLPLSKEEYTKLAKSRTNLSDDDLNVIYELFLSFEGCKYNEDFASMAHVKGRTRTQIWYDDAELVLDLIKMLEQRQQTIYTYVYVDEVQDVTPAVLRFLLLLAGNNPDALTLGGDIAQQVIPGVVFKYSDINGIMHKSVTQREIMTKPEELYTNFRTHSGVLNLGRFIIELLERYFHLPRGQRDRAINFGPLPQIWVPPSDEGSTAMETFRREIGQSCDATLLFRTEADLDMFMKSDEFEDYEGKKMTIARAKGLEFDNVILVNFFSSSSNLVGSKAWRHLFDDRIKSKDISTSMELELRLLYTAVTRCKSRFFIVELNWPKNLDTLLTRKVSAKALRGLVKDASLEDTTVAVTIGNWLLGNGSHIFSSSTATNPTAHMDGPSMHPVAESSMASADGTTLALATLIPEVTVDAEPGKILYLNQMTISKKRDAAFEYVQRALECDDDDDRERLLSESKTFFNAAKLYKFTPKVEQLERCLSISIEPSKTMSSEFTNVDELISSVIDCISVGEFKRATIILQLQFEHSTKWKKMEKEEMHKYATMMEKIFLSPTHSVEIPSAVDDDLSTYE